MLTQIVAHSPQGQEKQVKIVKHVSIQGNTNQNRYLSNSVCVLLIWIWASIHVNLLRGEVILHKLVSVKTVHLTKYPK